MSTIKNKNDYANSTVPFRYLADVGKMFLNECSACTTALRLPSVGLDSSSDENIANRLQEGFQFDRAVREYVFDTVAASLNISSLRIDSSIGDIDFQADLSGIGINTPVGNYKWDPTISCTENASDALLELLDNSTDGEFDRFCSNLNDVADLELETSFYSDDRDSFLSCSMHANLSIEEGGIETHAQVDGCMAEHKIGNTDICFGHGQAYLEATQGTDGIKCVIGGEMNLMTLTNENIQAKIGLSTKTGVDLTTTDVDFAVLGLGFHIESNAIGISTPLGSVNVKL